MSEQAPENVVLEGVEETQATVASEQATPTRSFQFPMLFIAIAALAFAGNYVWANFDDYKALVTGEENQCQLGEMAFQSCCSDKAACEESGMCPAEAMAAKGSCSASSCSAEKLMAMESCPDSGCPLSKASAMLAEKDGSCCSDSMSKAIAAAMLESSDKDQAEEQVTAVDDAPPAPPMPEATVATEG